MADEQYRWLNRETAERLLRGESVEAVESVDASARDQAERLAKTLDALSVPDIPASGELPGEAAAVAAFRKAAEARASDAADLAVTGGDPSRDVGLVRIGGPARAGYGPARSRRRRPVRLGLAAALLLGSLGGATALAATGVIPGPFDHTDPGPAASVSAPVTPDPTAGSATPDGTAGGGSGAPSTGTPSNGNGGGGPARDGSTAGAETGAAAPPGGKTSGWRGATAACRDLRHGKNLGVGRKRALEEAAGGASRVWRYCRGVLKSAGESSGSSNGNGNGNADGGGQGNGNANGGGQGEQGNQNGNGGDDDGPIRGGHGGHYHHHRDGTALTPAPAAFGPPSHPSRRTPAAPQGTGTSVIPSPDPTYSAL
ncbi:hypothetical protein [Streptomyces sp. YIM S03343]